MNNCEFFVVWDDKLHIKSNIKIWNIYFSFRFNEIIIYYYSSCHKRWVHIAVGMCLGTGNVIKMFKNDDWLRLNRVSLFGLSNTYNVFIRCIWVTANEQTMFGNGILTAPIASPFRPKLIYQNVNNFLKTGSQIQ